MEGILNMAVVGLPWLEQAQRPLEQPTTYPHHLTESLVPLLSCKSKEMKVVNRNSVAK